MSITEPKAGTVTIDGYHGHVYYAPETRTLAEQVRETLTATFGVEAMHRLGHIWSHSSDSPSPRLSSTRSCHG